MSSDIVIEITGLKSLSKFIGLEDTPLYYDNGKFFKVENNKIVYTDIEWKDISGNISDAPQITDLIEELIEITSGEVIQEYIKKHNDSESAHPYIQNTIQEETFTRIEADNTLQDNIDITNNNLEKEIEDRIDGDTLLQNNINNLSNTVTNNYNTLDDKIDYVKTSLEGDINDLSDTVSQNYTDLNNAITTSANTINIRIDSEVSTLNSAISTETTNRQNADNNLQSQIDAIVSSSDVFDIVGTYAELQAYDISIVPVNDVVKVLVDSSHNNAATYYRCVEIAGVKSWSYIGSEGAYYTKSESDTKFVNKTTTINNIPLLSNITLTASDIGAMPNTTTIEDLTTTAQQNALNSGATSAKIEQITTNTNNITTNTNDISTINDKIPYKANKDLSNLTNLGDGVNRAVKGYNEDGNLIYDKELVQDVTKYAHSTFNKSGFTVIGHTIYAYVYDTHTIYANSPTAPTVLYNADGSNYTGTDFTVANNMVFYGENVCTYTASSNITLYPNITDDGIASGFSSSNYLTKSVSGIDFTKPFKITQLIDISNVSTNTVFGMFNVSGWALGFDFRSNRQIRFLLAVGSSETIVKNLTIQATISNQCYVTLEWNGNTYILEAYDINGNKLGSDTYTSSEPMFKASNITAYYIGRQYGNNYSPFINGSIDLKQLSIKVDGVEVFSGNKTGIDTIKPDDYTVVGTPTISEDGVASGFSNDNYLTKSTSGIDFTKPFKIEHTIFIPENISETNTIQMFNTSAWANDLAVWGNKKIASHLAVGNSNTIVKNLQVSFSTAGTYNVYFEWTGSTYILEVYDTNDNLLGRDTYTSSEPIYNASNITTLYIGRAYGNNYPPATQTSIDLNASKIYVDGNLVYQPCLKIPYTESAYKHGSKIVDIQYLPRVKDAYEQEYPNRYYALQEDYALNCSVVGTPTIAGTQVSGFSASNYLTKVFSSLSGKALKIQNRFLYDSTIDGCISHGVGTNNSPRLTASATNQNLEFYFRGTSDVTFTVPYSNFTASTWYNTEAIITPTKQILQVTDDNGNVVFKETKSTTQTFDIQAQMATYTIGYRSSTNYFSGTVDLAGFKVFVDGNFVGSAVVAPCVALPMGDIYGEIVNLKDLKSDLDRINQTKALGTGNVANYEEEFKEIQERLHSSFDLSKFTVVGSPNITNDGIASSFSSSNYIKAVNTITVNANSVIKIKAKIATTNTTDGVFKVVCELNDLLSDSDSECNKVCCRISPVGYLNSFVSIPSGSSTATNTNHVYIHTDGTYNDFEYIVDNKNLKVTAIANNTSQTFNMAQALPSGIYYFSVGNRLQIHTQPFIGDIDLKNCEVEVDGISVINFNQTGIDTIKPDDYTVVGTPTISADGIASGFSSSNYIQKLSILPTEVGHNYIFKTRYNHITNNFSGTGYMFDIVTTTGGYFGAVARANTKTISFVNTITGNSLFSNKVALVEGKTYDIEYHTDFSTYAKYYVDGDLKDSLIYSATGHPTTGNVLIGAAVGPSLPLTMGSIDLNSFKIYVDGNLVYQPCLKIPYTESKTGSKIVNSIYRDRVNDMASQFGSANYYTLDKYNRNFTLPKGELYGLMGNKTLRDSYYNGVTYWELYSNRRLEQGGTCESGVEYTLPKPFADTNYILTIPYSSKTETSFIPSATGDFIAKGTGLL